MSARSLFRAYLTAFYTTAIEHHVQKEEGSCRLPVFYDHPALPVPSNLIDPTSENTEGWMNVIWRTFVSGLILTFLLWVRSESTSIRSTSWKCATQWAWHAGM